MVSVPSSGQIHDVVKTVGSVGTPFTTSEVCDSFDCDERILSDKLETLVDDGLLQSKEVGADERVWWRPTADHGTDAESITGPYQQLFESTTKGLCILEVVFDGDGQPADYRFLSTNPAFESFTGLENVEGTRMREMGLEPEDHWFEKFGRVAKWGESMRFTQYAEQLGERWYEIDAVRVGDPDDHTVAILLDETTDTKEREQEHRSQQEWREAIFEGSRDAVFITDPDAAIVDVNAAAAELTGYEREELLSMRIPDLHEEMDMDAYREYNDRILAVESMTTEAQVLRADGSNVHVEFSNRSVEIDGDVYIHTTARDVTERKQREMELEQHEIYLENISECISVLDENGIFRYESPNVSEQLGYDPDERIGELAFEYVHPADRDRVKERFQSRFDGDGPETTEFRARAKDGTWIWLEAQGNNLIDSQPIDGMIITTREITERKEREAELKRKGVYLENVSDGITVVDKNGLIRYESPAVSELLGYDTDERIGESPFKYAHPEDRDRIKEAFENRIAGGEPAGVELRVKKKNGNWVWIETRGTHLSDSEVLDGLIVTYRDITERKQAERKRKQIIDRITDGIFETNADGEFTYLSDQGRQLLNASDVELLGRDLFAALAETQGTVYEERFNTAMESREPTSFVAPYPGRDCWLDVQLYPNDDGGVSAYFRDVTERKEREQAQQRAEKQYQTLLEVAPLPIVAVDMLTDEIVEANNAAGDLLGYQQEELVGSDRDTIRPTGTDELHQRGFQKAAQQEGSLRNLPDGSPCQLATQDGDAIPVEITAETVALDGRDVVYGIIRDITDERQYQQRLSTLNDITQSFSEQETKQEVKETAADILVDLLDVSTVAFYRFDEIDWELRPVVTASATDAAEDGVSLPVIEPGNGIEWTALKDGQTTVVDDFETGELGNGSDRGLRSEIAVPVDEECVFVVGDRQPDAFDRWTVSLVETLGAAAETALTRAQQQQQLHQQNQKLRKIESLNQQIRDIAQAVVDADTRAEFEELVCEQLTNAEMIDFVWIGRLDHQANRLSPTAQAGTEQSYLDSVSLTLAEDGGSELSVQAVRSRETCICSDTTENLLITEWRAEAVERDFRSALSIPLVYNETLYGVVSLYSQTGDGVFSARQAVLEELGELLAHTIVAQEQKNALHTNQPTTLEFDIWDEECRFTQIVAGTDCSIEFEGLVPQSGNATVVYVRVTAGNPMQVVRQAKQIDSIDNVQRTETDTEPVVQFEVNEPFIGSVLADTKFVLTGLQATGAEAHLDVEVPTAAATRKAVTLVKSQFETAQLVAKRRTDAAADEADSRRGDILECLTSRQREVVETAYQAGYFNSPRAVNGAEVAEMFGFSDTTFHQHIRAAQSRLYEQLLSVDEGSLSS